MRFPATLASRDFSQSAGIVFMSGHGSALAEMTNRRGVSFKKRAAYPNYQNLCNQYGFRQP